VDKPTQEELYAQYHLLVHFVSHRIAARFGLPNHVAQDIAQAGFLGMLRSLRPDYHHTTSLVRTCINNASRDAVRGEARHRKRFIQSDVLETTLYAENLDAVDNHLDVTKLLSTLPPQQCQILQLTYLQEVSDEEAASTLHLTLSALRREKAAALAALQASIHTPETK
jgi:RNA polymerase sigma factor (sigma-70 family)